MPPFPWAQYGIIGAVVGALFFILWRMMVWVMSFVKEITAQHNIERVSWLKTLDTLNTSIDLHNQGSIEARKSTEEAHKYQREEHQKLAEQNSQICQALARINGYKER